MFVRKSLRSTLLTLLTAALFLASCTLGAAPVPTVDVNAINTAAVATAMGQLSAQFTQTALAAPTNTPAPTNTLIGLATFPPATVSFNSTATTPLPGFTPLPTTGAGAGAPTLSLGDACHNSAYEGDITIPDGTVMEPGVNFDKVWAVRNTGTCKWDEGFSFVYIGGSTPNLDPVNFNFTRSNDFVDGGDSINMTIQLTTPCQAGTYQGTWRMKDDAGNFFGEMFTVIVEVRGHC